MALGKECDRELLESLGLKADLQAIETVRCRQRERSQLREAVDVCLPKICGPLNGQLCVEKQRREVEKLKDEGLLMSTPQGRGGEAENDEDKGGRRKHKVPSPTPFTKSSGVSSPRKRLKIECGV